MCIFLYVYIHAQTEKEKDICGIGSLTVCLGCLECRAHRRLRVLHFEPHERTTRFWPSWAVAQAEGASAQVGRGREAWEVSAV